MTIKQGEMTTKTILSIVGIIALIIGALFSAGSIQRNLFGLSLAYESNYKSSLVNSSVLVTTLAPVALESFSISLSLIRVTAIIPSLDR
jgi:hypothetical protein